MITTNPNPPLGPYPQERLCGQVGKDPKRNNTSTMIRMVDNMPVFRTREPGWLPLWDQPA